MAVPTFANNTDGKDSKVAVCDRRSERNSDSGSVNSPSEFLIKKNRLPATTEESSQRLSWHFGTGKSDLTVLYRDFQTVFFWLSQLDLFP